MEAIFPLLAFSLVFCVPTHGQNTTDMATTMCGNNTLEDRIMLNVNTNDQDGNKFVTGPEIFDDLTNNYDVNQDGCVDKQEWMEHWKKFYQFSPKTAEALWQTVGDDTNACPASIDDYKTNPVTVPTDVWADILLGLVISQVCSKSDQDDNCDCLELKPTCQNSTTLSSSPACITFLACDGKGTLSDRLMKNIQINDADGNKVVTGQEFFDDLSTYYDTDKDGCVSLNEWTDRWQSYFQFSKEYAEGRFIGNTSAPCPIDYNQYAQSPIQIPLDNFVSDNIQTLIDVCNSTSSYMVTNCDCAQLTDTCQNDDYFKTIESCINYVATLS